MQIETIKQLVNDFRHNQKTYNATETLYAKNEKVFRKMSFEELNKALKPYGLKCLIDECDCCSSTHDHLICEIDNVPIYPISLNDPRLSNIE